MHSGLARAANRCRGGASTAGAWPGSRVIEQVVVTFLLELQLPYHELNHHQPCTRFQCSQNEFGQKSMECRARCIQTCPTSAARPAPDHKVKFYRLRAMGVFTNFTRVLQKLADSDFDLMPKFLISEHKTQHHQDASLVFARFGIRRRRRSWVERRTACHNCTVR